MSERDEGAPSFTKRISEIGLLAAVLIYFTGWTFISELFRQFGLSSHVIDIPVYSVFVYAYDALYKTAWGWVTMGVGVAVFASAAFVKPSRLSMTSYLFRRFRLSSGRPGLSSDRERGRPSGTGWPHGSAGGFESRMHAS